MVPLRNLKKLGFSAKIISKVFFSTCSLLKVFLRIFFGFVCFKKPNGKMREKDRERERERKRLKGNVSLVGAVPTRFGSV